jgi:hypothetical protein
MVQTSRQKEKSLAARMRDEALVGVGLALAPR